MKNKIVVVTHQESVSSFFLQLEDYLRYIGIDLEFNYYASIYSGYSYLRKYKKNVVWLPREIRKIKSIKPVDFSNELDWKKVHLEFLGDDYAKSIDCLATKYLKYFEKCFSGNDILALFCWGEGRMFTELPKLVLAGRAKVYNFEQGPYNTYYYDPVGVNGNSSFDASAIDVASVDLKQNIQKFLDRNKMTKFYGRGISFSKILDVLSMAPPKKGLYLQELNTGEGFLRKIGEIYNRTKKRTKKAAPKIEKYVLLALQVPTDAQTILHSPVYKEYFAILSELMEVLDESVAIVVREHPLYQGRYGKKMYDLIDGCDRVYIDNSSSLEQSIRESLFVVTINSTVGLEALLNRTPVVAFGKAVYNQCELVECVLFKDLRTCVDNVLCREYDEAVIDEFLYKYFCVYLKNGNKNNLHNYGFVELGLEIKGIYEAQI